MEQKPCVFCGIVSKQILSNIVYEDDVSIAFLDVAPRSKGMTIVVPKQHYKEFDENFELSQKILQSALIVAEMVKQALQPKSISLSIIPSEAVPHFHARIYPVYENEMPLVENQPIQVSEEDLKIIAEKIKAVRVVVKKEEKVEEPKIPEEKTRSPEEIFWIKRSMDLA